MSGDPASSVVEASEPAEPHAGWEIPVAACVSALFFAAFLVVPLVGALGFPFAAVPVVRLTHRRGLPAGLLAVGLAAVLLFGVSLASGGWKEAGSVGGAAMVLIGLPPLFAGRARRAVDSSRAFLGLCIAGCALLVGLLFALPVGGQPPMGSELRAAFDAMIPSALESYRRASADAATLEKVRATLLAARDFTVTFWPGLVGACWVLGAAVAFYAGARTARPAPSAEAVRFETLRVPPGGAGLFVGAGAGFVFLDGPARTAAGSLLLTLAVLYFVAGLSIICHFAQRWFRARILRLGLYVLVAYFPMNLGVALLGLFDWYGNFRRRGEKE